MRRGDRAAVNDDINNSRARVCYMRYFRRTRAEIVHKNQRGAFLLPVFCFCRVEDIL